MSINKPTRESEPDRYHIRNVETQFDDPSVAKRAESAEKGEPAQVTPQEKKDAEKHPERVPPPGDMGPSEGPSS